MPVIKSSAELRNNYNEISTFCHTYTEPVFITKNGKGYLAFYTISEKENLAIVVRFLFHSKLTSQSHKAALLPALLIVPLFLLLPR